MNYLAHFYLSGADEGLMLGNFMGDFVKGSSTNDYPEAVRKGIMLHREIDSFTDTHEVVKLSKKRLWERHRHYAPVIVDVFYDHFLAVSWSRYSDVPLKIATEHFYDTIRLHENMLPPKARHMFSYMSRDNWLFHYQYTEGVRRTLAGLASRTKFESGMEVASESLVSNYQAYQNEFDHFFPDLLNHITAFKISMK